MDLPEEVQPNTFIGETTNIRHNDIEGRGACQIHDLPNLDQILFLMGEKDNKRVTFAFYSTTFELKQEFQFESECESI